MSTRCNIKLVDKYPNGDEEVIWLYRHSDGYPSGVHPTLSKFIKNIDEGKIRDNVSQSAGWLILFGADEYGQDWGTDEKYSREEVLNPVHDWKCGAYEPTTGEHGDIEYLYVIDFKKKTVHVNHKRYTFKQYIKNGAKDVYDEDGEEL